MAILVNIVAGWSRPHEEVCSSEHAWDLLGLPLHVVLSVCSTAQCEAAEVVRSFRVVLLKPPVGQVLPFIVGAFDAMCGSH